MTAAPSASSSSPKTASLSFTKNAAGFTPRVLLRDSHRLHRRTEFGIGLRHEFGEVIGTGIDHTEPAAGHELLYSLLAAIFFSAAASLSRTSAGMPLGATMPRHAAVVQSLPIAAFSVGTRDTAPKACHS